MSYNIAICDDIKLHRKEIIDILKEICNKSIIEINIDEFENGDDLAIKIKDNPYKYDIVFLDIIMNSTNGIDIGKLIKGYNERLILVFITSSKEYVFDGYDTGALNYLLKPVNKEKLKLVFERAICSITKKEEDYFCCKYKGVITKVPLDEIEYFESIRRVMFVCTDTTSNTFYGKISEVEEFLPHNQFARCHKGYIVNIKKIKEINKGEITLESGKIIPISKTYLEIIKFKFVDYLNDWCK
ncbi:MULTISPECIES: LytTR family DNA-binding domain-containing protein [Clostridium]|uniref:Stage 0 sporulation protein A homolog n=1 Tax=Clostridium senegalense TaxID=1465809 RepID=A0A6M0H825_9CLOT|nr:MULTISPECIES: LytTR family DNA-binding domain-containing protein [Clostridium]NEU06021.1 response regulator transcription factor [Clostridium senegalense]